MHDDPQDESAALAQRLTATIASTPTADPGEVQRVIGRAIKRGQAKRRRVRLWQTVAIVSLVGAGGILVATGSGKFDNVRAQQIPPAQSTEGELTQTYELPPLEPQIDLSATPSVDGVPKNWRKQVAESMTLYPGTFVVPDTLPGDISLMHATTFSDHPVIDVIPQAGPGVIICADELGVCQTGLEGWPLIRTATVDGVPVQVMGKPAEISGSAQEQSEAQLEYWQSVTLTLQQPEWLAQ